MPRDVNGNYSLVAGNPVAGGTPIEPTWANDTLNDMATAMTQSLSREGEGGMNAPFLNADGLVGTPGITWVQEPGSGFYRAALNDFRAVIAGNETTRWIDASGQTVGEQKPFEVWDGTAWGAPIVANPNVKIATNLEMAEDSEIQWFNFNIAPGAYTSMIKGEANFFTVGNAAIPAIFTGANGGFNSTGGNGLAMVAAAGEDAKVTAGSAADVFITATGTWIHNVSSVFEVTAPTIQFDGLAGTGTRNVVVDANGLMSAP